MDVDMDNMHDLEPEVDSETPTAACWPTAKSPMPSGTKDNGSNSTSAAIVAVAAGAWEKNWAEPYRSESLRHVRCHLEDGDLWREFDKLGTEMIITRFGR
ncbi:T-box transcription factor TBX20 [Aphelenchoides avenae]|nr:T-box transcription factor TBX20 [Aphelenchus avenae]